MVGNTKIQGTQSEPVANDAPDDLPTQLTKAIKEAEAALMTSPPGTPNRFKKLDNLACVIADKHTGLSVQGVGDLPEAIEYAKEALEACPVNHVHDDYDPSDHFTTIHDAFKNKGTVMNTLQNIYGDLYESTKDAKYLDEGIKYGEQAVEFMEKYQDQYPPMMWHILFSRRAHLLAGLYINRFKDPEFGKVEQDLDNALVMQGKASDESASEHDMYVRFGLFCDLLVLKSETQNDVKYIDSAIHMRSHHLKKFVNVEDDEQTIVKSYDNCREYCNLLARRWQMTDADEDFDKMIEAAKELVEYEAKRDSPREWLTDPESTKDILRMCAINMAIAIEDENSTWRNHLPSIETGIALMMRLVNLIPIETKSDFEERNLPVCELVDLFTRRWQITEKSEHAWAVDDINVHSAKHNACRMMLRETDGDRYDGTGTSCSYGWSVAMETNFLVFDNLAMPIEQPRLYFKDPVCAENWIRKRNDDGTFEAGATEEDTDVWEFLQNYSKPKVDTATKDGATAEHDEEGGDRIHEIDDGVERVNLDKHDTNNSVSGDKSGESPP